jgi:integrase
MAVSLRMAPKRHTKNGHETGVHVVQKGSAVVKIYTFKNRGKTHYSVTWFLEGKRHRKSSNDFAAATKEANDVATLLNRGQAQALTLRATDRESYLTATRLLAPLDMPLHDAIREYVRAREVLKNEPLVPAVQFYISRSHQKLPTKTVQQVYDEFKRIRKADGASERYLQDIQSRLGRFARDFRVNIGAIDTPTLDGWSRSLEVSARSRKNIRILLVALFNFAKKSGYLLKDIATAADGLPTPKVHSGDIEIYTPSEIRSLLSHADEHTLPILCLGGFAGLRTAEIERLSWDDFKWTQKVIEIRAKKAKTGQRRMVPILPALRSFLLPFSKLTGGIAEGFKIDLRMRTLADNTKIPRKHNALRHSYVSYRLASIKDPAKVAYEMGNSPAMIFESYRALVTAGQAGQWWKIRAKADGKIVPISLAA